MASSGFDDFLRLLARELGRVTSPERPPAGLMTWTFDERASEMASKVKYKIGIQPNPDPQTASFQLFYSVNGAPQDQVPVVDGQEFIFPTDADVVAILVPVSVLGVIRPDKGSDAITFVAKDLTPIDPPVDPPVDPTPDVQKALPPAFEFVGAVNE